MAEQRKVRVDTVEMINGMPEITETVYINPLNCQFFIMVPEHYREDGSCKCNDPEHQAMMICEWDYKEEDFNG